MPSAKQKSKPPTAKHNPLQSGKPQMAQPNVTSPQANDGIAGLLKARAQSMPAATLAARYVEAMTQVGVAKLARQESGIKRAKQFEVRKALASAVYSQLEAQLGRRPQYKEFMTTLQRADKTLVWKDFGAESWWKKLRRGKPI